MMAKRYHSEEHVHKEWVVDVFVCPDCEFCFDATHTQADKEGGWVCPACAEMELAVALNRLKKIRDQLRIAEAGLHIADSLYMNLLEILDDNGPIDFP